MHSYSILWEEHPNNVHNGVYKWIKANWAPDSWAPGPKSYYHQTWPIHFLFLYIIADPFPQFFFFFTFCIIPHFLMFDTTENNLNFWKCKTEKIRGGVQKFLKYFSLNPIQSWQISRSLRDHSTQCTLLLGWTLLEMILKSIWTIDAITSFIPKF